MRKINKLIKLLIFKHTNLMNTFILFIVGTSYKSYNFSV